MKTVIKALFLSAAVMASAVNARPTNPEQMSGKTALQFWADNGIKVGWNLGNTLDAYDRNAGTEGVWWWGRGAPNATQALFNGVKASGFDIVRIPVTWIGHIGASPNYTVSEARLQRVAEVVDYAKNAGIKAVIINVHHDGNRTEATTWGFLDLTGAENNTSKKNDIQTELGKVWTQIANYFKNYGDYLIFETMNEVHNGNWGNKQANETTAAYQKQQDILFDWNKAALDAIRATGGNNATRFVAVPGLGSTEPETVINAHNRGKLLPSDGANGTGKLIVSVHYYYPWQYTVADVNGTDYTTEWKQSERGRPASDMGSLKSTFINNGIAVYAGEWGAPNGKRASSSQEIKDTHRLYIKTVATKAVENGVVPIFWDDNGNFKLLDRSNGLAQSGSFYADVLSDIMSAKGSSPPPPPSSSSTVVSSSSRAASSSSSVAVSSSSRAASSSSAGGTPITNHSQLSTLNSQLITYYSLKGEPLGNAKPQKAGVYIVKQGSSVKKIAVR